MMRHTQRAALVAALALVAASAAADWRESYQQGRAAFEAGRWNEVIEAMQAAIAERSEERSGTGFLGRRYTPRYYLGVAFAELGRCRDALRVFDQATALGQIQNTVDGRDLVLRADRCRERVEAIDRAQTAAQVAVAEAVAARTALAPLARELGSTWTDGEPSLDAMRDQADRLLRQARQRLAEAEQRESTAAFDAGRQLAEQAIAGFRDAAEEARSRRVELARQRDASVRSALAEAAASAERSLRGVRDLTPYPAEVARRVRTLEALVTEASAMPEDAAAAAAADLERRIAEARQALNGAARRPVRSLLDAAERYLAGDFAGTLEALAATRLRERRARDQICLFRAAAAWSLRETAGAGTLNGDRALEPSLAGTDPGADAAAPADADSPAPPEVQLALALDECRDLDPAPTPHPTYFSPRFIRFFERAMASPEDAGGDASPDAAGETSAADGADASTGSGVGAGR